MSDVIMFGTGSLMNDDTKRLGYLERTAENEALLADEVSRRIRAHGKATPKLRRQLAVNLGKILERLKGCFTIQDLALQSGIAGEDNVKPGDRISRFRIRPGVEPSSSVLGALSADTKHYLALAKCAAELAGEPSSKLVLELVDGTTLCPTLNRDLNIEPYEHMQRLIKTLVDEICLKHDLTSYFDAIRCNNLRLEKLDDDGITWWCDSCDWRYYRPLAFPRVYLATTALAQGSGTLFFGDHPPLPAKIWHSQSVELAIAVTADDPEPQPYFLVQDRTSIQAEYNYSDRIKFFELGLGRCYSSIGLPRRGERVGFRSGVWVPQLTAATGRVWRDVEMAYELAVMPDEHVASLDGKYYMPRNHQEVDPCDEISLHRLTAANLVRFLVEARCLDTFVSEDHDPTGLLSPPESVLGALELNILRGEAACGRRLVEELDSAASHLAESLRTHLQDQRKQALEEHRQKLSAALARIERLNSKNT